MSSLQWIGIFLLLWNITLNFAVNVVNTQDKLVKSQIEIINNNSAHSNNLNNMNNRISVLEGEFDKLTELSELPQFRGFTDRSCNISNVLQFLLNQYSSIDSQLKSLQAAVKDQAEAQKVLFNKTMDAIRSGQFKSFDEKLIELGQTSMIPKIIHELYAKSEKNFEIVLRFAKSLSKITLIYDALKSLQDEMRKNGHQDPNKLIILAETLESEVLSQPSNPNNIKSEANRTIDSLVDTIRTASTMFFAETISSSNYKNRVDTLAGALYVFRPKLSDEVIQGLIDRTYGKVDTDTILNNICSHAITAQALTGVNALFWKLKDDGKINSTAVLNLASKLSQVKQNEFDILSGERKEAVYKVVQNIPTCARNLFFTSKVCLWNKARNTYLVAADASFNYDTARRNIFTYSPPLNDSASVKIPAGALWYGMVYTAGDKFLFKSYTFDNEFLYVAAFEYDKNMNYVFTWIPGYNTDVQSAFNVELEGDYCRLKSVYLQQYLFASEVSYKDNKSYAYVFTRKPGTSAVGDSDFLWQIRSC